MTVSKRRSSTDDKVEAKRKIIRRSLGEITAEVEAELRKSNLHAGIAIVVPSRQSLVTITNQRNVPPDEWSRMSAIIREIVGKRLGGNELRGRALSYAMVKTTTDDAADISS